MLTLNEVYIFLFSTSEHSWLLTELLLSQILTSIQEKKG